MSYLALDIGKKNIGLALSESAVIAKEYKTLINNSQVIDKIVSIIKQKEISKLIVGYPKNMDGTKSDYAKYVEDFIKSLKSKINIDVEFIDERLTTQEAYRQLKQMNLSKTEIEKRVDQYAAKIILEDYLI